MLVVATYVFVAGELVSLEQLKLSPKVTIYPDWHVHESVYIENYIFSPQSKAHWPLSGLNVVMVSYGDGYEQTTYIVVITNYNIWGVKIFIKIWILKLYSHHILKNEFRSDVVQLIARKF